MPTSPDIHDIKPLVLAPPGWWWIYTLTALGGCVGLYLLYRWWRLRPHAKAAERALLSPEEAALLALAKLAPKGFADLNALRAWSYAISEVLRAFVLTRFDLPATQLTTEEILTRLPGTEGLSQQQSLSLRSFLATTDAIKYARQYPGAQAIQDIHARAIEVVRSSVRQESGPPAAKASGE